MKTDTFILYAVCVNRPEDPSFNVGNIMYGDLELALQGLREKRHHCPQAYLAMVTFARCPDFVLQDADQGGTGHVH